MTTPQIDPATGERVAGSVQIDPETGERMNAQPANQLGPYKPEYTNQAKLIPPPAPAPAGNMLMAAPPQSIFDRARGVVANSAIGNALEQELPYVADKLGLHPTETVNSPTYQADKGQLLAPQYLAPAPTSAVGHLVRGALTGTGQLTSGKNLALGTGIAATGGMLAPALPALAAAGRVGMGVLGAKGVYDDAKGAVGKYVAGDTDGALETAGAALPNAALTLPALGRPIELLGNASQDAGVSLMDSYLKAGKRAYQYGAEPGQSVLEQGPGTSIGFTRQGVADNIAAAKNRVGASIPGLVDASSASIPRANLRSGVDAVMQDKAAVLNGVGGDPNAIAPLQNLRTTFAGLVDAPGSASPSEVYAAKRNLDENINWGRGLDPKDATVNNARREMRSALSSQLYDAAPELKEPSQQYAGLASAASSPQTELMTPMARYSAPCGLRRLLERGP